MVDDLSLAQFDILVWVLSCSDLERDFKSLLTLENIQEAATNHPKVFVPQDIPRITYPGLTNVRARERVQRSLIECIKVGVDL